MTRTPFAVGLAAILVIATATACDNNGKDAATSSARADISVRIRTPQKSNTAGTTLQTITVKNSGPGRATNIRVTHALGADTSASYAAGTDRTVRCTTGRKVTCTVDALKVGESATILVRVQRTSTGPTTPTTTSVRADQTDPDTGDNSTRSVLTGTDHPVASEEEGMPSYAIPAWTDGIWDLVQHYATVTSGDIDGDGRADLVGKSTNGIEAYTFDPRLGQWSPLYVGSQLELADSEGWDQPQYFQTIQLADIDGDHKDELLARGSGGIYVWTFDPQKRVWTEMPTVNDPTDPVDPSPQFTSPSWDLPKYYETIHTGDFNGDGVADVFGRGQSQFYAYTYSKGAWKRLAFAAFPDTDGYDQAMYYQVMQAADVDGDGRDELLVRAQNGLHAFKMTGQQWVDLDPTGGGMFADQQAQGSWSSPACYRTIHAGDLNGDGKADVISACNGLVAVTLVDGEWQALSADQSPFAGDEWRLPQDLNTVQLADIDGDGTAEVMGRDSDGLRMWHLQAGRWQKLDTVDTFSDANNWNHEQYYVTLQPVQAYGAGQPSLVIGRGTTGVMSLVFDKAKGRWDSPSREFPEFTGAAETAYMKINTVLGGGAPGWDLRDHYGTSTTAQLSGPGNWIDTMKATTPNVDATTWNGVVAQLSNEITSLYRIDTWFGQTGYMHSYADDLFLLKTMDDMADALLYEKQRQDQVTLATWAMVQEMLAAFPIPEVKGFKAYVEAVDVVNELIAAGATAAIEFAGIEEVSEVRGEYSDIKAELQNSFVESTTGFGDIKQEAAEDFGLLTALGQQAIQWPQLPAAQKNLSQAAALRVYDLTVAQMLIPALWQVRQFGSNSCVPKPCDYSSGGKYYSIRTNEISIKGPRPPTPALAAVVFGTPAANDPCLSSWNANCPLGQDRSWLVLGTNGWQKVPLRSCTPIQGTVDENCTDLRTE